MVEKDRILIVDDSATIRLHYVRLLQDRYDCIQAQNTAEALEKLKQYPIDLVITDVMMPGLSGVELLRIILDRYPQTVVIIVSGVDRPQRALDAVRLGAFDYLIKPCDDEVLEGTIRRALDRRRLLTIAARYKADLEARNAELAKSKAELEALQSQIIHNEKMASLGKLSAGIAHEINNPIAFISGNLELLDGSIKDLLCLVDLFEQTAPEAAIPHSPVAEFKSKINYSFMVQDLEGAIKDCREGVDRVREIVKNLRTFSRLDEADVKLTDIHEGIESTVRILSRYFTSGKIKLVKEYGDVPLVEAHSAQLNQVWMNLLVNAAQAIGLEQGEVRVATAVNEGKLVVSISDTGKGIDPGTMNKIFDPFFTTKPVGEGTGLGLSISFGIVQRHNGKIEAESEHGKGTTFRVSLPLKMALK